MSRIRARDGEDVYEFHVRLKEQERAGHEAWKKRKKDMDADRRRADRRVAKWLRPWEHKR